MTFEITTCTFMFLPGVNMFFANACQQYLLRKLTSVMVIMVVNVQRMYTLFITCKLHSNANTIISLAYVTGVI